MRSVRAVWKFLSHPVLSVAGNISLLFAAAPLAVAVVAAAVGWILDQPILFLIAIGLAVFGLILVGIVGLGQRSRSAQESLTLSTEGAQSDTERLRPPAFIAVEAEIALAYEECLEMAKILRAEWPHITPDSAVVQAALPDWQAKTTDFIGAVLGSAQRAAFKGTATGDNALERLESEGLFLCALAVDLTPSAIRANEAEVLSARAQRRANESASLFSYEHSRAPGAPLPADPSPPPADLADQLDSLMRKGIELVSELTIPVEPEKTEHGWKLEGDGGAPDEWWDKADALTQDIRKLLIERHPALLTDFRDGFNGYLQRQREAQEARNADASKDKRPDAEKILDLVNYERSGPSRVVEASLEGLATARHRLGVSQPQNLSS